MKVLFVVSSMTRKQGGHFYSLLSTAKAVSTTASVKIISVGRYKVALFKDGGVDYIHIRTSIGFFRALFTLTKEVKTWHPDVMHSFDVRSFFLRDWFRFLLEPHAFKISVVGRHLNITPRLKI